MSSKSQSAVERRFYSVNETADLTGVSVYTIRRMINRSELRAGKFGNSLRIPAEAIDEAFQWVGGDAA